MAEKKTEEPEIVIADLDRTEHQAAVLALTDAYARDPMGAGRPLPREVRDRLISGLQANPNTRIFLAYQGNDPVGLATCFLGFSTFHARPLLNIHDLVVLRAERGNGVGRTLLAAVEQEARALACCKLTLEVNEQNRRALRLYCAVGFARAGEDGPTGSALFYAKALG